jgi:SHS2 domain-containing protein
MPGFEFIEHTADYAIRATGADLGELIQSAGQGLIALTVETEGLAPSHTLPVTAQGATPEDLLMSALRELLYLTEDRELVPVAFIVTSVRDGVLRGEAGCVPLAEARDHLLGQIKAVTYHDLAVREVAEGLQVEIVFDT